MRVINFSEARGSLKGVIDQVIADADYTVIARRDAPDAPCVFFRAGFGGVNRHVGIRSGDLRGQRLAGQD